MESPSQHHAWVNPETARCYQVRLEGDLFGDGVLRKVWGGTGSNRGRMHSTAVASYDHGVAQVGMTAKHRVRRGHRSVPMR